MREQINYIITLVFILSATVMVSQNKKNDTISTGVIDVVKPYTPSISDAFKVSEIPSREDEDNTTKKDIKYNIFSFPVASTFKPAKGKAAVVEKAKPIKLYDNYATLGVGSYTTILGEVYLNHALSRTENVGGYLSHHSSQGGIEDVEFDDNFSNSQLNVNYGSQLRDLSWNVEAGYEYQMYNWYGVAPSEVTSAKDNGIKEEHVFNNIHFGGDVAFNDTYINSGSFSFNRFTDDQGSGENRFVFKAKVDVPIGREEVSTNFIFDYLGGAFDRSFTVDSELKYGNFQVGISPTYQMKQDDLTVNAGFSLFYLNDTEASENKFYIYPKVTASYRLVNDVLIAYGGIEGDLIQNTYNDFASENPFVSPTLFVSPTDQQYNVYLGLKGKLSSNMSYNISGLYVADKNKALYKTNVIKNVVPEYNYDFGNSFGIVYDDIDTFGFAGELNVDVNRNFTLALKAEYFSYATDGEAEAWNLPDIKGTLFLDYQINEQWFAGANIVYTGERKDQMELEGSLVPMDLQTTVTLDSFFDANAHVGYHINDQISVFAKANNMANNAYQRWQNYPVQGIQFLAGATFKFDF